MVGSKISLFCPSQFGVWNVVCGRVDPVLWGGGVRVFMT